MKFSNRVIRTTLLAVLSWVAIFATTNADVALGDGHTVSDVQRSIGKSARNRLLPFFANAKTEYPPRQITLLAVTNTATLELWSGPDTSPEFIREYGVTAKSVESEGIYEVKRLHVGPDSRLSIELNHNAEFDHNQAPSIFVLNLDHAAEQSLGSLGIDAEAIEELFVLAADVGKRSISIVVATHDPRLQPEQTTSNTDQNKNIQEAFVKHSRKQP